MSSNRGAATPSSPSPDEGATASSMPTITTGKILSLALPSLGALIAEPLFTVIDSTMVGHLGTPQLAGLGIASTVLNTAVGLFIFLAYSTTSLAGRHLGAGRRDLAIRSGVEAMWLAGGLGADNCVEAAKSGCAGLDFNSGVESQPGIKDASKLASVFQTLRAY